jgi:hypothetical protein
MGVDTNIMGVDTNIMGVEREESVVTHGEKNLSKKKPTKSVQRQILTLGRVVIDTRARV